MARQVGTSSAVGQARHRERKAGKSIVSMMQRRTFKEVEHDVTWSADIAGRVQDCRVLSNRNLIISIEVPAEYAHEALDVTIDSKSTFTFFRVYQVPIASMLRDMDSPEDQ